MRGEVVDREVMRSMLQLLIQKLALLHRLKLTVELGPRCGGKSAAEINAEARALADEQGQQMAQHLFQRAQFQSQLRALLTPEQLKQLDERQAAGRPMDGKGPRPQPR